MLKMPFAPFPLLLRRRFSFVANKKAGAAALFAFSRRTFPSHPRQHKMFVHLASEVKNALNEGRPVVALESALITHGLAYPLNLSVALRLEEIVRGEGATPATIALMDGQIRVGLNQLELERIAQPADGGGGGPVKVSLRDISNCVVQKKIGGTTVAATIWIAHRAGIKIFATGGIGGVHRGAQQTMDVSADLIALGKTPIAVVCAGVKSILDIGKTLEFLETQSVNVIVLDRHSNFPGFFSPRTKFLAPFCTESLEEVADILLISEHLGLKNGTLLACPRPEENLAEGDLIEKAIEGALAEANQRGIRGKEMTPFVLKAVSQKTGDASVRLNIQLLENNARVAARLAVLKGGKRNSMVVSGESTNSIAKAPVLNGQPSAGHRLEDGKGRPKIVCIGAAIVDFEVLPIDPSSSSSSPLLPNAPAGQYVAAKIVQRAGGVARNHADALTRLLGQCEVAFLSALGADRQQMVDAGATFLMANGAHMDWSHVLRCRDQPTASSIGIGLDRGAISHGFISVDHLMAQLDSEYIDSKAQIICDAQFVVMDANLGVEAIQRVQYWAQKAGTKIWFDPTNALKVPKLFAAFGPNPLANVDIFSPNFSELAEFIQNLEEKEEREAGCKFLQTFEARLSSSSSPSASLLEWLHNTPTFPSSICPKSHLLVTCDRRGVLLLSRSAQGGFASEFLAPPQICAQEIVSVSGAGDCFNSAFLSAQLNGLDMKRSLELAKECARMSLCSAETVPERIGKLRMNGEN